MCLKREKWLATVVWLLVAIYALPFYASESMSFRNISSTDGLSDLMVCAFCKDSKGRMWIGTATSVEWFDGVRLRNYPYPPLSDGAERLKWVNTIVETHDGRILMGSDNGLWTPAGDQLQRVLPDVVKDMAVHSIVSRQDGTLYVATSKGLVINKGKRSNVVLLEKNNLSTANDIRCMDIDKRGIVWLATRKGVYSMTLRGGNITYYPNNLLKQDGSVVYRCMTRIGNVLYIGTMSDGIYAFDTVSKSFSRYVSVGEKPIMALGVYGKDVLYVGTDGNGIHFISTKEKRIVRSIKYDAEKKDGIRSNGIYALLIDRDGLLWAGLYQYGFDYTVFRNNIFSLYETPYFSSEGIPVRAIYIGKSHKLIGSLDGLYFIDEVSGSVKRFKSPAMRSDMIVCIHPYHGKVLIGTYEGGMYVLDPQTATLSNFAADGQSPFFKGSIFGISADRRGDLWIGTTEGLFRYRNGRAIGRFTPANSSLPGMHVYSMYFDSTGNGWVCTDKGICLWDSSSERMRTDVFPKNFINKEKINMIYEDSNHKLYFLFHTGNIWTSDLTMDNCRELTSMEQFKDRKAAFITEDSDHWLWIGTNNGLYRYDKKSNFEMYGVADGIPSPINLYCMPQRDADGTLWIGNSKGLVSLRRDWKKMVASKKYKMRITQILVNGTKQYEPLTEDDGSTYNVSLRSSDNDVTICFSDFSYINPSFASYEYKLDDEQEWSSLIGKSEVALYNLDTGQHMVKIRRAGDKTSEICVNVRIGISPYLVGLISLCVVVVAGVVFVVYKRRKNVGERQNSEVEQYDREDKEKYKSYSLTDEKCRQMAKQLEEVMRSTKPFTNSDMKMTDLASIVGVAPHTLSYLFNQYLKKSYYDYVNEYRIAEFKQMVKNGDHVRYTLETLIELCGFSSRSTFFRSFKKLNGMTPNEYIKNMEQRGK